MIPEETIILLSNRVSVELVSSLVECYLKFAWVPHKMLSRLLKKVKANQ